MKINLDKYNHIFFDCDGVILDSNKIKTEAFYTIASEFDKNMAIELVKYHESFGGISRHVKFRYFFEELLKRNNFEDDYQYCLDKFSCVTLEKLKESNFTDGIEKFLTLVTDKKLYVVSGGLESDLDEVFKYKKIFGLFEFVGGSPDSKYEIVLRSNLSKYDDCLFIGDAITDFEVAKKFDMDFLFLGKYSDINYKEIPPRKEKNYYFNTFLDLLK